MEFPSCYHIGFINLVKYTEGEMSTSVVITLLTTQETKILLK